MAPRLLLIKYFVWAAALTFALAVAFLVFMVAAFGRGLGPKVWSQTATNVLVALCIGLASQAGLALAPVVRGRGVLLRGASTILMAPALVLGVLSYRDVFARGEAVGQGMRVIEHPLLVVYPLIVPVYVAVVLWMWRGAGTPARSRS